MPNTNGFGQAACARLCSPALLGAATGAAELALRRAERLGTASRKRGSECASKPGLLQPLTRQSGVVRVVRRTTAQRNRDGPLSPVHNLGKQLEDRG